jgi:hypothetical protein
MNEVTITQTVLLVSWWKSHIATVPYEYYVNEAWIVTPKATGPFILTALQLNR